MKKVKRRKNRNKAIKIGNIVYQGKTRGIYMGMNNTLAIVKTSHFTIEVPFKNLTKERD